MPDFTAPQTELEAVNEMLRSIGERPVTAIDGTTPLPSDADFALTTLRSTSREVQTKGYSFNIEYLYVMPLNTDGTITIPQNVLEIDSDGPDKLRDVVRRGNKLYDRKNHTFVFTKPLSTTQIILLDFTDLPQSARTFITIRAARKFQQSVLGSAKLSGYEYKDELAAYALMDEKDADAADYNILTDTYDMQFATQRALYVFDPF